MSQYQNDRGNITLIRDPLYGFVELSAFERQIVRSKVMQRLLRIKQLAHTYISYPSAMHTRFEHSLGAMHVSGRMCDEFGIRNKERMIIKLSVLLHDIGHGPFSHVFEKIIDETSHGKHTHETIGKRILEHEKQLSELLGQELKGQILKNYEEKGTVGAQILSGNLDADKLDYLRRDTHHVGAAYGLFDFERVIRNLTVIEDETGQYIGIEEKGKDALESYRLARYLMHAQVYEHHARLIADDMFIRAVQFGLAEGVLDQDLLNPENDYGKFIDYYLSLDDHSIQYVIMNKSRSKAKELISAIQNRCLFKRAFWTSLSDVSHPVKKRRLSRLKQDQITDYEEKIATKVGIDRSDIFVHLQSIEIKLYERFDTYMETESEDILVRHRDGTIGTMEESPITALSTKLRSLYVFCPHESKVQVGKVAEDVLGVKNKIEPSKKTFA